MFFIGALYCRCAAYVTVALRYVTLRRVNFRQAGIAGVLINGTWLNDILLMVNSEIPTRLLADGWAKYSRPSFPLSARHHISRRLLFGFSFLPGDHSSPHKMAGRILFSSVGLISKGRSVVRLAAAIVRWRPLAVAD